MPSKKTPVKKGVNVWQVERNVKNFARKFEKEADVVRAESKEFGHKVWWRRHVSNTEEKVFTILGIILLILGLYVLRQFIWWLLLIVFGILFMTWYFVKRKK